MADPLYRLFVCKSEKVAHKVKTRYKLSSHVELHICNMTDGYTFSVFSSWSYCHFRSQDIQLFCIVIHICITDLPYTSVSFI
jgi:hypothetical protein